MTAKHHVIITGTGRAGTTFLIQLLTELKLDTGFTDPFENINSDCNAGMERALNENNAPYIIKDPHLSLTLGEHLETGSYTIDHAFIPVRPLDQATKSRLNVSSKHKQRWWKRLQGKGKFRSADGGLFGTDDPEKQADTLAEIFYNLVAVLVQHEVQHTFMSFPRIISDPEYLYKKLAPILKDISLDEFIRAHKKIADVKLVNRF